MNTKVAVSSQNKKTITGHAGGCRNFFIYTIDKQGSFEKTALKLSKEETLRFTFHDDTSPDPSNKLFNMDIIITQGIGQGGINKLAQKNVKAYIVQEKDPDTAIKKMIEGTLMVHSEGHQH